MDTILGQITLGLILSHGIVYCEPALSNQYGVPGNFGVGRTGSGNGVAGGNNQIGGHRDGFGNHIYDDGTDNEDYLDANEPKSYEFGYAVKDQATGNDFGRQESSDGQTVRGEYRVHLPDGRIQIVTYTADWRTGFHADVRYEGTPTYPDQPNLNGNNNPGQGLGQSYANPGNNIGGYNVNAGNGYNQQPYQFGSNGLANGYNSFGARTVYASNAPSPTYGPGFH